MKNTWYAQDYYINSDKNQLYQSQQSKAFVPKNDLYLLNITQ